MTSVASAMSTPVRKTITVTATLSRASSPIATIFRVAG